MSTGESRATLVVSKGSVEGARCAAYKAVFNPDAEPGGDTNVVVRRDPATGDATRVVVHRWCRPGQSMRSTSYALADA